MQDRDIATVIRLLRHAARAWREPAVTAVARRDRSPFRILIACLLSLRTKDDVTHAAAERLFALADTPETLGALPQETIARTIYPVGFYKTKARTIREVSTALIARHGGAVPADLEQLLALKGVGRKTANLVITQAFGKPGICVDTHVHRITNRWGYVETKDPVATEFALRARLQRRYWIPLNDLLVSYGQNLCTPISPWCSRCPIASYCDRVGVTTTR